MNAGYSLLAVPYLNVERAVNVVTARCDVCQMCLTNLYSPQDTILLRLSMQLALSKLLTSKAFTIATKASVMAIYRCAIPVCDQGYCQ